MRSERQEESRHQLKGIGLETLSKVKNLELNQMIAVYPLRGKPFRAEIIGKGVTKQKGNPRVLVRVDHSPIEGMTNQKLSLGGGTAARLLRSWS